MNKTLLALAAAAVVSALPAVSYAEEAASPLSFNVSLTSEYRYRGISQSRFKPALQGGVDYAFASGFYVGSWASTIKTVKDAGGGANIEWDLYGGYKGSLGKSLSFDVGALQYVYPDARDTGWDAAYDNPNTTEIYGALTFGPATVKYSHSLTNLFGNRDSEGSGYLEAAASFDVGGGVSLTPHVGYQRVVNNSNLSYTDVSLTASKDVSGFVLSASLLATDTKDDGGAYSYYSPSGKNLGRAAVVLAVKKTF